MTFIQNLLVYLFCKNARKFRICRFRSISDEFSSSAELQKSLADAESGYAAGFYVLLRAVDRFAVNYSRFPGQVDGDDVDEDVLRLKSLLGDSGCSGSALTDDLITEMCRYGAGELHAVGAIMGGIAAHEVIKLITRQFVPMSGTFIFNGIDHKSKLLFP